MKAILECIFFLVTVNISSAQQVKNNFRKEVSQYGITWTFNKPAMTGQFITGDWWVTGPVTIVKITPAPGPARADNTTIKRNKWNDTSLSTDTTMRNGSMIVLKTGTTQCYDSRSSSFRKHGCITLPLELAPEKSLISSISNDTLPVDNFCKDIMWDNEKKSQTVMKAVAVLSCLQTVPPGDAFRPPYAGEVKPVFRSRDIQWGLLPKLTAAGKIPDWSAFERYFQRPWIDHILSWSQQELVPNENQPNYGREYARLVSIASLMVMLDVPRQKKEKLTIALIQRGIDLYGLAMAGGHWNEGGGHSSGRKWPILFASIMLKAPKLAELPQSAVFHEDTQTYYGKGWFGQTALWQMVMHHGPRQPYEEKAPDQWEQWDKTSESYRVCCNAAAWTGTALAARYMKAIRLWGHDAHFDYLERWMREDDPYKSNRAGFLRPSGETQTFDPFVTAMWMTHRRNAPEQPLAGNSQAWVWKNGKGVWATNEKSAPIAFGKNSMQPVDAYKPDFTLPRQIPGMSLQWNDEFNINGKPNPNSWRYETGFVRNQELQWYNAANAHCINGTLVITAKREEVTNLQYAEGSTDWRRNRPLGNYTSASLQTRGFRQWQYGRFEIRARIDTSKGSWPAIWTLGTNGRWPDNGEIDIMEFYRVDNTPTILANVAWGTNQPNVANWDNAKIPLTNFTTADPDWTKKFHVWRMDWNEDSINLLLDDSLINTATVEQAVNPDGTRPFSQPHYLLLNLAIGGNGGDPSNTRFPLTYEVDYVRVYQKQ
ncbi:MAG: glycoside hydrolase family 16 protein [Chitinophagaceae bacterium]